MRMMYRAWMIPGMKLENALIVCNLKGVLDGTYPRMVRRMLIRTSAPQPLSRKTPRGGRMMAAMICGGC